MKKKKIVFQAVIFFLSVFLLTGLWINDNFHIFSALAVKNKHKWDDCPIGRLCRAPEDNKRRDKDRFPDEKCVNVSEGCLDELKCTSKDGKTVQWFNLGRRSDCGHKETQEVPTPTPTPIPTPIPTPTSIPTPTPTPTPTPGPTARPTPTNTPGPTPTPTPPQVLGAEAPKKLPVTGFPAESLVGLAVTFGSLGWYLIKRFR